VQEAEKFMLKIINGNLLDSDCQYIAHQCNCYSRRGAGLASGRIIQPRRTRPAGVAPA
jgi:O-acetyl-ADP-ribose deacetylase (regulator of RNase III)